MPVYNFKSIKVVPTSNDFVDIVLSKTQRQTPTVVHNGWAIQRIRQFYMRKVKYTQQSWHEKIAVVLEDFPKVDDIHPFYADLMNVLYDKDHYKLALGQLNVAQKLIDKLAQDYVRLLKYGDSLYRCKQLKRAALGRMCTLMKRQSASLAYLEQVRQHLSRLPSIDPHTRTLLVCGYPNVGKSSFMNKVTRADVEVQPYAFTTKSLYIGHMDYRYLRWQVIDTPGVLDRPLEERNTIEMQSITALAHLRAAVLYVVDVSEECGYTLQQQAALFHSIKPLFANKPVMVVANKIDMCKMEDLSAEQRELLAEMERECLRLTAGGVGGGGGGEGERALLTMSTLHEEGVMEVKQTACDRLLEHRVDAKMQGKRAADIANRVHVAMPAKRDGVSRPPCIPATVRAAQGQQVKAAEKKKRTEKDMQEEMGGAGVYSANLQKHYLLEKEEWKYDIIPEIMDGHNILDFVDPDIDACLAELEQEEEQLEAQFQQELGDGMEEEELTAEEQATLARIKQRKAKIKAEHRMKKGKANNQAVAARVHDTQRTSTTANLRKSLEAMGYDSSRAVDRARARSKSREGRKRTRSADGAAMDLDGEEPGTSAVPGGQPPAKKRVHSSRARTLSRGRSVSLAEPTPKEGVKDAAQRNKAIRMADRAQKKRNLLAHAGESDRRIPTKMPKHLFSGKRGKGKTDRR